MMESNTTDFRCRKLPNHLQKPHLFGYTVLTVKYTALFFKRRNNDQNQKRRLHQNFCSIRVSRHFSREKSSFWTRRPKFTNFFGETHFHSSELLIKLILEPKSVLKILCHIHLEISIGKTLRLPENINKSDHLLL